jgi:hypothetical protein
LSGIDPARIDLVVASLENGASIEDASALAKLPRKALEAAWLQGMRDADASRDTPEAILYLDGRAAAARWRIACRTSAADDAERGHRSAADWLKLLEESSRRGELDSEAESSRILVPIDTPEAREAAATLLALIADSGPSESA